MKKSVKNFADTKPTRNKDYDAGEILKKQLSLIQQE